MEMKSALCLPLLLVTVFLTDYCNGQGVNCTMGDFYLYNSSAEGLGMLQQCDSTNQWQAVCNDNWDCSDIKVACRQLGFKDSRPNTFDGGYFGKWENIASIYYDCSGSEQSLQECTVVPHPSCNMTNNVAGLACHPPLGDCTHGDLRLVGGESESEGRVEVCYKGGWYSVCGTEDEEASVMCKQLGYTVYPWAAVFTDGKFGNTPLSQGYITFECSDDYSENRWTNCMIAEPSCDSCNGDAIKCFTPPECEEGNVRLVDGIIDNEGRVEVCLQGIWGTVGSDVNWQEIDGYVACKKIGLGNSGKAPELYFGSTEFGDGKQPLVVYAPHCSGWEKSLTDCPGKNYGEFFGLRSDIAGVLCYDDCDDGELRLVGGASNSEGTVEVCLGRLWGLISISGWSLANAKVVCKQLGFPLDEVQAVNKSHYGKPKKPVHLSPVHCTGNEQQLLSCDHLEFSTLEEKKNILSHLDVAGVSCQPQNPNGNQSNGSTDGSGSESCDVSSTVTLLVPTYTTMLLVMIGIVLGIVGFVICWRNKNTNLITIDTPNKKRQAAVKNNSKGTLQPQAPRYEMSNTTMPPPPGPPPPSSRVSRLVRATAIEEDKEDFGPLYETTEATDYDDMA